MKHIFTQRQNYTSLLLLLALTLMLSCEQVDDEISRQNAESGIIAFEPMTALLGDTVLAYIKNGARDGGASLKIGNVAVDVLDKTDGKYNGNDAEIWKIIVPRTAPFGAPPAELTVRGERKPAFYGLTLTSPPALVEGKVTASLFAGVYREKEYTDCGYEITYPAKDGPVLQAQFGRTNLVACSKIGGIVYVVELYDVNDCFGSATSSTLVRKIEHGMVTTVAGGGDDPNGNGLSAKLPNVVKGFAVSPAGLLYLSVTEEDYELGFKSSIISIDPLSGNIGTVAGGERNRDGTSGSIKDGPALEAKLDRPGDISFDGDGNLYFIDMSDYCIRKLDVNGNITTLFGPIKTNVVDNETYLAPDYENDQEHEDGFGNQEARFGTLTGIATASNGKVYVVDKGGSTFGHCIREINPQTQEVATIIGLPKGVNGKETGSFKEVSGQPPGTYGILGMDTDFDGNLLLTNMYGTFNMKLFKVDLQFETVKLIAGGGSTIDPTQPVPGNNVVLYGGTIAFDEKGNLYIGDNVNYVIRKIEREK